jgi:transposase
MPVAVWRRIEPYLPVNGNRGKQWKSHRRVINGILWRFRTGCPWRDVPARYGKWQTVYGRFRDWELDGTWARLFTAILAEAEALGAIEWIASVDSTVARAHQHAAGAQKGAVAMSRQVHRAPGPRPVRPSQPTTASAGPAAG